MALPKLSRSIVRPLQESIGAEFFGESRFLEVAVDEIGKADGNVLRLFICLNEDLTWPGLLLSEHR